MKKSIIIILSILCIGCEDSIIQAPVQAEVGITAAYRMATVDSLAKRCGRGMLLYEISSAELNTVGTSPVWYFDYEDTKAPAGTAYRFYATFDCVALMGKEGMRVGPNIVQHSWFDSDLAIEIAENNGGREFRNKHPGCTMSSLLTGSDEYPSRTYWYVDYNPNNSQTKFLDFILDANTGSLTSMHTGPGSD